jgi:hypothetical protein
LESQHHAYLSFDAWLAAFRMGRFYRFVVILAVVTILRLIPYTSVYTGVD